MLLPSPAPVPAQDVRHGDVVLTIHPPTDWSPSAIETSTIESVQATPGEPIVTLQGYRRVFYGDGDMSPGGSSPDFYPRLTTVLVWRREQVWGERLPEGVVHQ